MENFKTTITDQYRKVSQAEFDALLFADKRYNKHAMRDDQFEIWLLSGEVIYIVKYITSTIKDYYVKA